MVDNQRESGLLFIPVSSYVLDTHTRAEWMYCTIMYVHVDALVWVCLCDCVCVCTCLHTCVHACVCVCMCMCACACMRACVPVTPG